MFHKIQTKKARSKGTLDLVVVKIKKSLILNLLYNKTKPLWDLFTTREKACMYNVANLKHSGGKELFMTTAQLNIQLWYSKSNLIHWYYSDKRLSYRLIKFMGNLSTIIFWLNNWSV